MAVRVFEDDIRANLRDDVPEWYSSRSNINRKCHSLWRSSHETWDLCREQRHGICKG